LFGFEKRKKISVFSPRSQPGPFSFFFPAAQPPSPGLVSRARRPISLLPAQSGAPLPSHSLPHGPRPSGLSPTSCATWTPESRQHPVRRLRVARTPRVPALAYKRRHPHPVNPSNRSAAATPSRNPSSRAAIVAELGAHRRTAVPSLPRLQKLPPEHRVVVRTHTGPFPLSLTLSFARDSSSTPSALRRRKRCPVRFSSSRCPRCVLRAARVLPEQDPS